MLADQVLSSEVTYLNVPIDVYQQSADHLLQVAVGLSHLTRVKAAFGCPVPRKERCNLPGDFLESADSPG